MIKKQRRPASYYDAFNLISKISSSYCDKVVKFSIYCRMLTTKFKIWSSAMTQSLEKIRSFKDSIPGSCTTCIAKLPLRRQVPSFPPNCTEREYFHHISTGISSSLIRKKYFFSNRKVTLLQTTELVNILDLPCAWR